MNGFGLFELSQRMRETPEFARLLELERFSNTLRIFEENYRELDRLLWFICQSPAGDQLFRRENRSAWEVSMAEVIRLLQNFVASASALVDHSRRLHQRMYIPSGLFPEYEKELKKRFADNEVIQFVHGLRNYCLHYRTPSIGTTTRLVDPRQETFVKQVSLDKRDLLDFDWNSAANRFLRNAEETIDLKDVLAAYHSSMDDFYDWFSQQIRVLHASDFETVSASYAALLSAKGEQQLVTLESRLKAFEAGIGTPFDVLSPFMTPSEAADIAPLLRNPHDWIEAAITKVSKYFSVGSDVAPRIQNALRRWSESSPFSGYKP